MPALQNTRILLGVTGGIAAYKSAELVRMLQKQGADVRVVMTQAAQAFITPLTLQALSGHNVHTDLLDPNAEAGMGHIELARWPDLIIIAPTTADFIAKLSSGQGDDLLSTICLATNTQIALAVAMNQGMWHNSANQANISTLKNRSIIIWGPADGEQACGDVGMGRMLEPTHITELASNHFKTGGLQGKKVVITAGPTQEPLDPVRYISNHSSGKMGYALAAAAVAAGAKTILISGPTSIPHPDKLELIQVTTAQQMLEAAMIHADGADIFIAAAAVCDYRPQAMSEQKIKKTDDDTMKLILVKNPDIVSSVANLAQKPYTVGFAAETENLIEHAKEKLARKNLDLVIANDVSDPTIGFNSDYNAVAIIDRSNKICNIPTRNKDQLARDIILNIIMRMEESQRIKV